MLSLISKTLGVLVASTSLVRASDSLQFPSVVTAGQPATLTVNNAQMIANGDSLFRVSLVTLPPPSNFPSTVCWLVNATSVNTTTLDITIPPDVGPSGRFYALAGTGINLDLGMGMSGYAGSEDSNNFTLKGGTAQWSPGELKGVIFGFPNDIPCTSYNCVRNCTNGMALDFAEVSVQANKPGVKQAYECMASCPGVHVPSWAEITDGNGSGGDDSGGDDSGSSSSNPAATDSNGSPASQSTSTSAPSSGTSNSADPAGQANTASQIVAGIPIMFSLLAGILLI